MTDNIPFSAIPSNEPREKMDESPSSILHTLADAAQEHLQGTFTASEFLKLRTDPKLKERSLTLIADLVKSENDSRIASGTDAILTEKTDLDEWARKIFSVIFGLGPLEPILADPATEDIAVTGVDEVVVRTYAGWETAHVDFASTDEQLAFRVNQAIASEGKQLGPLTPIVDAVLPDGSRLSAIGEPVTDKLVLVIRKHREAAFQLMDFVDSEVQVREQLETHEIPDYIGNEVPGSLMSGPMATYLHLCVLAGLNILVIGRTGVGKTAMLSALGRIIPENRRVLVLEDTRELNIRDTNCAYLTSVQKVLEGGVEVSMQKLIITALRQRPDHLILGEARGAEIYDLLNAMQTGHGGNLTSIHANSLADLPQRVNAMLFQAGANMDNDRVCALIGTSFHVGIVLRQSLDDGRRYIQEIGEFTGEVENGRPLIHPIALGGPDRGFDLDLVAKESSFEEEFRSNGLSFSKCIP